MTLGNWKSKSLYKDVSFNEDSSRIRINADIFVRLRSFALNIMRAYWDKNIKSCLYENSLNFNAMIEKYLYYINGIVRN